MDEALKELEDRIKRLEFIHKKIGEFIGFDLASDPDTTSYFMMDKEGKFQLCTKEEYEEAAKIDRVSVLMSTEQK